MSVVNAIVGRQAAPLAPGDAVTRLFRTGLLTCGERPAECTLILYVPATTMME